MTSPVRYQTMRNPEGVADSRFVRRLTDFEGQAYGPYCAVVIPNDPDNADWQLYLDWLEAGGEPAAPAEVGP